MDFKKDAIKLLELIGGASNVKALTHCLTRLRFVLNDESIVNKEEISNIESVKGTFFQAGQFQIIIGNKVDEFYKIFIEISNLEGMSKEEIKKEAKIKQNIIQKIMTNLAEIFAPIIPALVVGGLILGFRNVIGDIKMFTDDNVFTFNISNATKTLVDLSQFFSGVNSFLWLIGEAIFHFLPVAIVWSVTRKMKTTEILGIILGITLVSPQLLNAYAVANAISNNSVPYWNFGIFKLNMIGYQAQVIPAMLAGFTLVYLEKFLKKITPTSVSMIVVPFMSLILSVIFAHSILGPIGWKIGTVVSNIVFVGLTSNFKVLFAAIFGFCYAPLVITGLHHMTNAIDLQLMSTFGGTLLWPMIALSNIAQGSAVLAMSIIQRKDVKKQEVNIPSMISCYLGVTEPAMFGVNLKYKYTFLSALIGSMLAAIVSVQFGVKANSIGVGGLPGFLSIQLPYWGYFFIAMLIAFIVPIILILLLSRKKRGSNEF